MTTTPVRVMIIDDNKLVAGSLERRFAIETGIKFSGWLQGLADAAAFLSTGTVDVALVDVDMPGDSFEFIERLSSSNPSIKCVIFSGHVRTGLVERAINAGAWGYVSKNEGIDVIIDLIHRAAAGEFVLSPEVEGLTRSARPAEGAEYGPG